MPFPTRRSIIGLAGALLVLPAVSLLPAAGR